MERCRAPPRCKSDPSWSWELNYTKKRIRKYFIWIRFSGSGSFPSFSSLFRMFYSKEKHYRFNQIDLLTLLYHFSWSFSPLPSCRDLFIKRNDKLLLWTFYQRLLRRFLSIRCGNMYLYYFVCVHAFCVCVSEITYVKHLLRIIYVTGFFETLNLHS